MSTLIEQQTEVPAGTWQADTVHSSVGFEVSYLGISTFSGEFSGFEATLTDGALAGKAPVSSIEVKDENLKAHLQAPDFFDAERTPEVSFRSTDVRRSGDHVSVAGDLTIKGQSQPVELEGTIAEPIADPYGTQRLGLKLQGTVDRTKFGINWNNPLPSGDASLANDVTILVDLQLSKES